MMKRSVFLALAAGVIASVAITAPARAGSVVTVGVFKILPVTATTSEVDFFYQDSGGANLTSISNLSLINSGTLSGVVLTAVGTSEVKVTFAAANSTDGTFGPPPTPGLEFKMDFTSADGFAFGKEFKVVTTPGDIVVTAYSVSPVPEPASLALLGIGMTGFLAFRRFFKKTSVA
jgi:PEP-CTERM motif